MSCDSVGYEKCQAVRNKQQRLDKTFYIEN